MRKIHFPAGSRSLILLLALLLLFTIPGVYGVWMYGTATGTAKPASVTVSPTLNMFTYSNANITPYNVLVQPGDATVPDQVGQALPDALVQSLLHNPEEIVYSEQELSVYQLVEDTIYCYTFSMSDVQAGISGTTRLDAIRSTFYPASDGTWQKVDSQHGSATVTFAEDGAFLTIDVSSWIPA